MVGEEWDADPELVFPALANPRRREILVVLAKQGLTSAELAAKFPDCSYQAIAKHLGQLREAHLVTDYVTPRGRSVLVVDRRGLGAAEEWMGEVVEHGPYPFSWF